MYTYIYDDESKPTTLTVNREYNISSSDLPLPHKEIVSINDKKKGRSAGNIGSSCYNIALALLRLDRIDDENLIIENQSGKSFRMKPFIPSWWP